MSAPDGARRPGSGPERDDHAALVEAARALARARFRPGWHSVAVALRASSGRVFTAIHLDANVGRVAVCAEAIALGMAVAAGEHEFEAIVAVRHPKPHEPDQRINVVSPCGLCREMLTDYAPDIVVLMPDGEGVRPVPAAQLLPDKYRRGGAEDLRRDPSAI